MGDLKILSYDGQKLSFDGPMGYEGFSGVYDPNIDLSIGISISPWERPSDWIDITDVSENTINLLIADIGVPCIGFKVKTYLDHSYNVNFGDASSSIDVSSNSSISHLYQVGGGVSSSEGYTTYKCTISSDSSILFFVLEKTGYTSAGNQSQPVLWARFNTPWIPSVYRAFTPSSVYTDELREVSFVNVPHPELWEMREFLAGCKKLRKVILPDYMPKLSTLNNAFQNCAMLESFRFPDYCPDVSNLAGTFSQCYTLNKITNIPTDCWNKLTTLNNTFAYCNDLVEISLPERLPELQDMQGSFTMCNKLEKLKLQLQSPKVYTLLSAFESCFSLQDLILPNYLPEVSTMYYAFNNCYLLDNLHLPELPKLTDINSAFANCRTLRKTLDLSASPIKNMQSAFNACYYVPAIILPSNLDYVQDLTQTFRSCYSLEKLKIPTDFPSCTSFNYAFADSYRLEELNFTNCSSVSNFANAFQNCNSLKKVTLPALPSAQSLYYAFYYCRNLEEVILPTDLPEITNMGNAFYGCSKLKKFKVLTGLSKLRTMEGIFYSCDSIMEIVFPPSLPALDAQGADMNNLNYFNGCYNLKTFDMPECPSLRGFGNVFNNCMSLTKITIPDNTKKLTSLYYSFYNCFSLSEVTIPLDCSGITTMDRAFNGCGSLKKVNLPENLPLLRSLDNTFYGCRNLEEVIFPSQLPELTTMSMCFYDARNLTSISLPVSMPKLTTTASFLRNTGIKDVSIYNYPLLTNFSQSLMACTHLERVSLDPSLKFQNLSYSFADCPVLEEVILPINSSTSLTDLSYTFNNCYKLKKVVFPPTLNNVTNMNCTFRYCWSIPYLEIPATPNCTNLNQTFSTNYLLKDVSGFITMGSSTNTVTGGGMFEYPYSITDISLNAKFSSLGATGITAGNPGRAAIRSLRLLNETSPFSGSSPQVDVRNTMMDASALNILFMDLPVLSAKTIRVTGSIGATDCCTYLATSRGWTVLI